MLINNIFNYINVSNLIFWGMDKAGDREEEIVTLGLQQPCLLTPNSQQRWFFWEQPYLVAYDILRCFGAFVLVTFKCAFCFKYDTLSRLLPWWCICGTTPPFRQRKEVCQWLLCQGHEGLPLTTVPEQSVQKNHESMGFQAQKLCGLVKMKWEDCKWERLFLRKKMLSCADRYYTKLSY